MLLRERFEIIRPLEEMESALIRASEADPRLLSPMDEAVLRTALSLARLYKLRHEGRDVGVGAFLAPFREDVTYRLRPLLLGKRPPAREALVPHIRDLREETLRTRDALARRLRDRIPPETIHKELRQKSLVMVAGGGGGTGYVYLGVMDLLEEFGVKPSLLAGTSIGAILSLFRSRMPHFNHTEMVNIVRGLTWKKLFRALSTESRYGVPGAMRLLLRAGVGRYFDAGPEGGPGIRLRDLPIPVILSVSGVRKGMLPQPLEYYARLLSFAPRTVLNPAALARQAQRALAALGEFYLRPEIMVKLHLGADSETREFDALDAAGFSCALPGVIHYDVLREDPRMFGMLDALFAQKKLGALIDGGLVDNLPARAAWRAVHKGTIGTRNAFILALNGFASRVTTPLWLPLQRLAETNVAGNRPYAHLVLDFKRTLSPLELVPNVEQTTLAIRLGREQLKPHVPFLTRMLAPLPML